MTFTASNLNCRDFVSVILNVLLRFASNRYVPGISNVICPRLPWVPGFGFCSTMTPKRGEPSALVPNCCDPAVPAGTTFATADSWQLRLEGYVLAGTLAGIGHCGSVAV